jgi:hypothetical protein
LGSDAVNGARVVPGRVVPVLAGAGVVTRGVVGSELEHAPDNTATASAAA